MIQPYYVSPNGKVKIYNADAVDVLRAMPNASVDAVITDPIYAEVDTYTWLERQACLKKSGNGLAFVNAKWLNRVIRAMETELPTFAYLNPSGAGMNGRVITKTHYVVWWGSGKLFGYIPDGWLSTRWSAPYQNEHKWVKNPKYIRMLITATTKEGDIVLDPFMGSGATGVECVKLNRNFVGVEINPKYCVIARQRIEAVLVQPRLAGL